MTDTILMSPTSTSSPDNATATATKTSNDNNIFDHVFSGYSIWIELEHANEELNDIM